MISMKQALRDGNSSFSPMYCPVIRWDCLSKEGTAAHMQELLFKTSKGMFVRQLPRPPAQDTHMGVGKAKDKRCTTYNTNTQLSI